MTGERRINADLPIVYGNGTMQYQFRDFIIRVDRALVESGLAAVWGQISGTLSDQTDLQAELDGKATAAQGALADTALQPGQAATPAQGALADTALQSGDNISELTNDSGYITTVNALVDIGDVAGVPTDGQVLTWVQANAQWEPVTPSAGGGSGIAGVDDEAGSTGLPADPNYNLRTIIANFDGTDGDTTTQDIGQYNIGLVFQGNAQINTNRLLLDGTGDFINIQNVSQMDLDSGVGFCVEAEIYIDNLTHNHTIFATGDTFSGGFLFTVNSTGGLQVFSNGLDVISETSASGTVPVQTPTHVALAVTGNNWEVFIGGVSVGTGSVSRAFAANNSMYIGTRNFMGSTGDDFEGYIEKFRLTTADPVYTANFTPPVGDFPGDGMGGDFDPLAITTTEIWLDATDDSTITDTAGQVEQWRDKTANNHNFDQASPSNRPIKTGNTLNGLQGILFDGSSDRITNTTLSITQPYTVFVVANTNSPAGGTRDYVFDGRVTSPTERSLLALRGDNTNNPSIWAGNFGAHADTTDSAFHVFRADYNGATSFIGIDGDIDAVNAGSTSNNLSNGMVLGANYQGNADFLDGSICEVVVLVNATAQDKFDIEGYLAWRWGLEGNLEAGHPYELAPPTLGNTPAYTVVDGDANRVKRGITDNMDFIIPSGLNFTRGDRLWIRQAGSGVMNLDVGTNQINGSIPAFSQHAEVQLRYVDTDEWDVVTTQ